MANEYIQGDLKFMRPPALATSMIALTAKEYLPKDGVLTLLTEKGARPHVIQGTNFRVRVGKKHLGNHLIAELSLTEPAIVKSGKDELTLDAGVYYILAPNPKVPPLVQ